MKSSQIELFFCFLVGLQPILERFHHCIAELLGWGFHIAGRFVIFRVVITPLVVVLPVDFPVAELFRLFRPRCTPLGNLDRTERRVVY